MRSTKTYRLISAHILVLLALLFSSAKSINAAPGDLDPTFGNGGIAGAGARGYQLDVATAMAIQPDGKVVIVGQGAGPATSGSWESAVVRLNPDGSLDTSFGGTGIVINPIGPGFSSVAIQPDGKIVAVATASAYPGTFGVVRYNPSGSLDTSFNGSGVVTTPFDDSGADARSVTIQSDGKIVVAGVGGRGYRIVRYNPNGSLDTSFNGSGIVSTLAFNPTSLAIQADGKIIAAGESYYENLRQTGFALVRYNGDGSLDTSLNGTGLVITPVGDPPPGGFTGASDLAIQSDGKIVVVGSGLFGDAQGNFLFSHFAVVRYNPDGSLDTSFGGTGKILIPKSDSVNDYASSVAIQPNGKIVFAGNRTGSINGFAVGRLNPNGSLDASFNGTGIATTSIVGGDPGLYYDNACSVALQADGKIVVAGDSGNDTFRSFVAVRYQGDAASATCANPIDCPDFFVRQHYLDFLSREPEQIGFQEWMDVLNSCNGDLSCLYGPDGKRTLVSQSFFGSQEFNLKGGYVFRFYKATLGRMPTYVEMEEAMRSVTGATADEVFQKRAAFAASWVVRNDFLDAFPRALSPADYVQKIETTAGITLASRNQIIDDLNVANNTDAARAVALRAIVDSSEEQNKEFNASFVYMQYVGYLRRDPEPSGYNSWLTYLNDHPGDFKTMVWGFVDSIEYRKRFGQP
jgi:uncharacterized delta-60 repeat protein